MNNYRQKIIVAVIFTICMINSIVCENISDNGEEINDVIGM